MHCTALGGTTTLTVMGMTPLELGNVVSQSSATQFSKKVAPLILFYFYVRTKLHIEEWELNIMAAHQQVCMVQWMEILHPLGPLYLLIQTHLLCVDSKTPPVVTGDQCCLFSLSVRKKAKLSQWWNCIQNRKLGADGKGTKQVYQAQGQDQGMKGEAEMSKAWR